MKKHLGSLLFVAMVALPAFGCVVHGSGRAHVHGGAVVVVDAPPPPPRAVIEVRPGFVWIEGRYHHRGGRYVWERGRYERERSNHRYVPGYWTRSGRGHVYVDGRWETHRGHHHQRGPVRRDYRR